MQGTPGITHSQVFPKAKKALWVPVSRRGFGPQVHPVVSPASLVTWGHEVPWEKPPLGSVTPARGERTLVPQRAQLQREQDALRIPRGASNQLSLCRSFFYLVLGSITPRGWGCQGWPLGCSPEPQELSTQPAGADSGGWHVVATRLE